LAASIQSVINEALKRMGRHVHQKTGLNTLVLAGGVALNCVATGQLSTDGPFDYLWTQPAAGDAGGALGAALSFWHQNLGKPRTRRSDENQMLAQRAPQNGRISLTVLKDQMQGAFLGPDIPPTSASDDAVLNRLNAKWHSLNDIDLQQRIATEIAAGKI